MIKAMPTAVRAESKAVIHRKASAARETVEVEAPPPAQNPRPAGGSCWFWARLRSVLPSRPS